MLDKHHRWAHLAADSCCWRPHSGTLARPLVLDLVSPMAGAAGNHRQLAAFGLRIHRPDDDGDDDDDEPGPAAEDAGAV